MESSSRFPVKLQPNHLWTGFTGAENYLSVVFLSPLLWIDHKRFQFQPLRCADITQI